MAATASSKSVEDDAGTGMEVSPELAEATTAGSNIVSLRSAANPATDERVPAFKINGKLYTMRTRPKTNESLRYVNLARKQGADIAVDFMMETLLGDGWLALMDFEDLTEDNLKAVITAATRIMTGPLESPKGKPPKGSRRSAG